MMRKLYEWVIKKSGHPKAPWFLSFISFTESSFFPVPPDILLIPMIISKKARAFYYAFLCTFFSVLGGIIGYCIGFFLLNSFGLSILEYYNLNSHFTNFEEYYKKYGTVIILGAGLTPFPFKVITIASGVFNLNIFSFILFSLIGRGLRFYLIAILLKIFGKTIENLIDKHFNILVSLFFIILIGGIMILKFL